MKEELRENASHGTIGGPIALYGWQGDQSWHVRPQWHEEIDRRLQNATSRINTAFFVAKLK